MSQNKDAKNSLDAISSDKDTSAKSMAESGDGDSTRKQSGKDQPVDALRRPPVNPKTDTRSTSQMNSSKSTDKPASTSASKPTATGAPQPLSPTSKTGKKRFASGASGAVVLGLVLVAAALGASLWWQQQRFEAVSQQVANRLQQSDQAMSQTSENAKQALSLAHAQREVLDQLRRQLAVTSNELKTLQQAWQSANDGLDQTLLLNDLARLINMANQELVLLGNVSSAVSILSSVDSMLNQQRSPALQVLQQAVITDLARLRAAPQIDPAHLSAKLDSLIQLVGRAPLLTPAGLLHAQADSHTGADTGSSTSAANDIQPPAASDGGGVESTGDSGATWWQSWDRATEKLSQWTSEASATLAGEFTELMRIRKADDPQALLLSEEQSIQLRANMRAMLLSAQLALMTRQTDIWQSELNEVQALLNTRFDRQALDTKAALTVLDELVKAPVSDEVPQINQTLNALLSAERALTIPAKPPAATKASDVSDLASEADSATDAAATGDDSATQNGQGS